MDHKNIHEALHAIYKEVGYVQKTKSASLNYSFAGESEFIKEVRPSMIEHGVTISVAKMDSIVQETYITKSGTSMVRSVIHGVVRFTHVSGTWIDTEAYGEASDTGDKSVNKAMTDLYKYALRQTFMIETGDDPDKSAPEERSVVAEAVKVGAVEKKKNPPVPLDNVPQMSLDLAQSVMTSKMKKYGDCDNDELTFMFNKILEREPTDETKLKLVAIQTILKSRGAK